MVHNSVFEVMTGFRSQTKLQFTLNGFHLINYVKTRQHSFVSTNYQLLGCGKLVWLPPENIEMLWNAYTPDFMLQNIYIYPKNKVWLEYKI